MVTVQNYKIHLLPNSESWESPSLLLIIAESVSPINITTSLQTGVNCRQGRVLVCLHGITVMLHFPFFDENKS